DFQADPKGDFLHEAINQLCAKYTTEVESEKREAINEKIKELEAIQLSLDGSRQPEENVPPAPRVEVWDKEHNVFYEYDSLQTTEGAVSPSSQNLINRIAADQRLGPVTSERRPAPYQGNGIDCGVYTWAIANHLKDKINAHDDHIFELNEAEKELIRGQINNYRE
ncbi:16514_t:CDS:2, partial [Funneliformis geosporum]